MPLAYRTEEESTIRLANIHQWGKVEMPLDASFARIVSQRENSANRRSFAALFLEDRGLPFSTQGV
jgi:hypothetical protein